MPPRRVPTQADLFYDNYWTEYVDLCFVIKLEEEAIRLGAPLTRYSNNSIRRARREVNLEFCKAFSLEYCLKRFQKLEERYNTFKDLVEMSELVYDRETNILHGDQFIWDQICMSKELGVAYLNQGDPCWDYLQRIFGNGNPIVVPRQVDVINISSDRNDSRVQATTNRTNSLTRNSGTLNRSTRGVSGASSTGRSVFSCTNWETPAGSNGGSYDDPSSQASCSWAELAKEL